MPCPLWPESRETQTSCRCVDLSVVESTGCRGNSFDVTPVGSVTQALQVESASQLLPAQKPGLLHWVPGLLSSFAFLAQGATIC